MKSTPGEFQHALVIGDVDKMKIWREVRKTCTEIRIISLLKDVKIRKRFEEKVMELVHIGVSNLLGYFTDGDLKVCGKKRGRRSKGDTWWWNEEVKEAVSR